MFGVLETDFSDPGPPPFFEDRPRKCLRGQAFTQRESPGMLRAARNVVTTLSATGHTPPHYIPMRCCAAHRWTTIARMRTLMTFVLNDGQQFVDAGLRVPVKRLKEPPSSSAELVLVPSRITKGAHYKKIRNL